jgi:hypothetical protein
MVILRESLEGFGFPRADPPRPPWGEGLGQKFYKALSLSRESTEHKIWWIEAQFGLKVFKIALFGYLNLEIIN